MNGLHKRWYKKNKIKKIKNIQDKRKKENPLYGIKYKINKIKRNSNGDLNAVIAELESALASLG